MSPASGARCWQQPGPSWEFMSLPSSGCGSQSLGEEEEKGETFCLDVCPHPLFLVVNMGLP